jgi:hypothetical protein
VHATCPAHHILLDLITQIIFGEGLESWSFSFAVSTSVLLLPPSQAQLSFSAPYFRTHSACVLPSVWETKFHSHKNDRLNCSSM